MRVRATISGVPARGAAIVGFPTVARPPCPTVPPTVAPTSHSLWRFAEALYAAPHVARTCLRLQDDHDLDVCILLACLWYARDRRRALARGRLHALEHRVGPIARWTARLRVLRRELEHPAKADPTWRELYETTKRTELEAEALELTLVHDALAPDAVGEMDAAAAAEASLFRYARLGTAAGPDPPRDALLHALVAALRAYDAEHDTSG